jgi:hypothetical protein
MSQANPSEKKGSVSPVVTAEFVPVDDVPALVREHPAPQGAGGGRRPREQLVLLHDARQQGWGDE